MSQELNSNLSLGTGHLSFSSWPGSDPYNQVLHRSKWGGHRWGSGCFPLSADCHNLEERALECTHPSLLPLAALLPSTCPDVVSAAPTPFLCPYQVSILPIKPHPLMSHPKSKPADLGSRYSCDGLLLCCPLSQSPPPRLWLFLGSPQTPPEGMPIVHSHCQVFRRGLQAIGLIIHLSGSGHTLGGPFPARPPLCTQAPRYQEDQSPVLGPLLQSLLLEATQLVASPIPK